MRWQEEGNESSVKEQFKKMQDKFVSKGYPVFVGEYGCSIRTLNDPTAQEGHDISRQAFYRTVTSEAKAHGCTPCVWGGMFDRLTGEVSDRFVYDGLEEGAQTQYPAAGM